MTPPFSSSSAWRRAGSPLLAALALATGLAACTADPGNIGVGLPSADATTGVYLLDTLTVRASTVLRDSVVTSSSAYMLVGKAFDPQLGTLTATSFFEPQLTVPFTPQSTSVLDSVALRLVPDTNKYRYGDTTQVQSLVRVYALTKQLPTTGPLFAAPRLTDLRDYYTPSNTATSSLLNLRDANGGPLIPQRRASPSLVYIRVRLDKTIGTLLFARAQAGLLTTQAQLLEALPGLAVTPGDSDRGALVRLLANSTDAGLILYYHDPADPATVQSYTFQQNNGRHLFQVTVDRSTAAIHNLPAMPLDFAYASQTGQQTVIEGSIGLQTRLEFPYLTNLRDLGDRLTIVSADVTLTTPANTLTPYIPAAPGLVVSTSNGNRQPVATYLPSVTYTPGISPTTSLDQGTYTFSLTSYINAVLLGAVPNNGLLLSSAVPELPSRAILGGPRNTTDKLQLRVYIINNN